MFLGYRNRKYEVPEVLDFNLKLRHDLTDSQFVFREIDQFLPTVDINVQSQYTQKVDHALTNN